MKFLLLALCVGLALAIPSLNDIRNQNLREQPSIHNIHHIQETSYRAGKEYLYHYDTQVVTGLPHTSKIHAGHRISCRARVQFNTQSVVRVQFEQVVLYRINEPVVQWKASERLIPEEFLKELTGNEAETMAYFLQIPFGFDYNEGHVLRIILEDNETTWSANVKRGFTSMFEMNLEKRFLMDESFPAVSSQVPPHANWYNVFERSPTGDCATMYTVTPNGGNDHMYVTKVRDYNQCLQNNIYVNSMWDGYWNQDAQKNNPLNNGASLKYNVRGNNKQFIILSAVGEGRIVFTPHKNEDQIQTSLNQTLYLRESKHIGHQVLEIPEIHKGEHKRDTLRMTLPSSPVDCQDPFMPCNEEPKQESENADIYSAEKIYLHLQMAARNTKEITSEESLEHLRIAKNMMKVSPVKILRNLWRRLHIAKVNPQTDDGKLIADIYWNTLPNVGTEAASKLVLDICATDFLMTDKCTYALRKLALKTVPTTQIVNKLIRLTNLQRLTRDVKQAAYLTLGSFGQKMAREYQRQMNQLNNAEQMLNSIKNDELNCIQDEKKNLNNRRSTIDSKFSQSEEKILRTLKHLSESSQQEDKILALKAIGNSGLSGSLPILRQYLENQNQPQILRIMAITAHRRIEYQERHRQQAIKNLLKVYLTTTETNEVRSMAFLIMTALRPDQPILESVASSLRHEKDAQVSSFVYSYLSTYANSTYFPDTQTKLNCSAAIKFAPEIQSGLDHSFLKRIGFCDEEYKKGNAFSMAMIGDMSRYMGGAVNWDMYNYGLVSQFMEVGFNTEGLNPFLNKLFGPKGLLTSNKSLFDLLKKRETRDVSPQEKIHQIFRTLNIKARSMPIPYGHIYFKMMGHELGYKDFSDLLRTITTTGTYPVTFDEDSYRVGVPIDYNTMHDLSDTQLTLPTEAGLPISLTMQAMSTVNIQGSVSFKVAPFMMENERQGQPPVAIHLKVDLKPKIVAECKFTMGLDGFFVKPVVGYRGIMKFNAPINREAKLDLTYKRLNLKFIQPNSVMEQPAVEMLLEPFSEYMLLTKNSENNESPVFMQDRRNIFAPAGTRIVPISHNYNLNALGYQLAITGQLPYCLSKNNPLRPFNGRSLLNIFWKPLENAPQTITLYAQYLRPIRDAVANSYAQSYQEILTTRPEQYGRDFSRMEQSGVLKFDKYGRPLPQSPEEILPYSDPVDLKNNPVNMQQLCNKFQKIFNKPMPFYNEEGARGVVVLLDASTEDTKRQLQLETLFRGFGCNRVEAMYTRFWRSSIPNYDTQDWQLVSEAGITYPFEVKEPKDIFNPKWQRELMNDLEYLISLESHKVVNQAINMTIMSGLEQRNYPAIVRAPTYRVLDGLVPEQLYRLMNLTGSTIYNRRWDKYWHTLAPLYRQVQEEVRVNVDPYFINRDLPLTQMLTQLLRVQDTFLNDLQDMATKTIVAHAEIPVIQWINYNQAQTTYRLKEIFNKATVRDLIHDADRIQRLLNKAQTNVDAIVSNMHKVMQTVTFVSQQLDKEGRPVVVFRPDALKKDVPRKPDIMYADVNNRYEQAPQYRYPEQSSVYNTVNRQENRQTQTQERENLNNMRMTFYNLALKQSKFIEQVQLSISNNRQVDTECWNELLLQVTESLNVLDQELIANAILDPVTRQNILLVTIQNQFCVELLEQYRRHCNEKASMRTMLEQIDNYSQNLMRMKEQGLYLGERAAILYHHDMLQRVVVPNLNRKEYPLYQQIIEAKREMVPELRQFQTRLAFNYTNMRDEQSFIEYCDKFCKSLTDKVNEISEMEVNLMQLGQTPKLYLVSELMDALHYLKFSTEFGSTSLSYINDQRRLAYLETLSKLATKVQGLISNLSPIFNMYENNDQNTDKRPVSILNSLPIDTRVLDVQDVIVQQKMMMEQIRRFIQNPEVSNDVLSGILNTVVDRCETLQETLKQNQVQVQTAMQQKQKQLFERQAISAVWSEALNQQRTLYEALLNIYNNNRDRLNDVVRSSERINALESEMAQLEGAHQDTLNSIRGQDTERTSGYENYRDTYRAQPLNDEPRNSQQKLQPLTPFEYQPTSVTGLLNFQWGNGNTLNKNAKIQLMASRSVEQIMNLFRQMSAVMRSEDIVYSVNRRLSDEPWLADSVMQSFNTFNHLHIIAESQREQLPEWLLNRLRLAQDYLKATYWNEYKRQSASNVVNDNQIQAMIDISDVNKQWDLYLLNNAETNVYQGLKKPRFMKNFPMFQNYKPVSEKVQSYLTYNNNPTKCMVNKDKVYTFDNVNYQLSHQLRNKETLLAADCTNEKIFAVTMVNSNTSFQGHTVKIMNEDKVIEITPGYLDIVVKVNGQTIQLDQNKPVVYSKKMYYDLYQPALKIVRKGWRVEVSFPMTGLDFIMEGTFVQLQVSQVYKRRVCGLCSNFDSQRSWEFEGPEREVYTSPLPFAHSYVINNQENQQNQQSQRLGRQDWTIQNDKYQDIVSHYRPKGGLGQYDEDEDDQQPTVLELEITQQQQQDQDDQDQLKNLDQQQQIKDQRQPQIIDDDDDDDDEDLDQDQVKQSRCQTVKRTVVKRRRSHGQICFSEQPIDQCPTDCPVTLRRKTIKVPFVCLDSNDRKVNQLTQLASYGVVPNLHHVQGEKGVEKKTKKAIRCQLADIDDY